MLLLGAMLITPLTVFSQEAVGVKMAVDLQNSSQEAKQQKIPVMLFFAAEDCHYCERLEADYLHGMANNEEYQKRVIIRKVVVDDYDSLRDFSGEVVETSDFSDDFNIQVTPTLVFVDHNGTRVSKRIVGYNASGFFGAELDNVINTAIDRLK